jgi:cytochrome d ubiquinol oxidase subunit I
VTITHIAFQLMIASGIAMLTVGLIGALLAWRRKGIPDARWFLKLVVLCGPLGFLAVEAGWTVTEVGRQPWIIYGIMRTSEAVTPMPWLVVPFLTITGIYLFLAVIVLVLLQRQVFASPREARSIESERAHGLG